MTNPITQPPVFTIDDSIRLEIIRKIADGGMGTVYEARQIGVEGFEKTVAIKTMLAPLARPEYAARFIAEAKLVANLVHENIVQIYQLGKTAAGYYIVMEYVRGLDLTHFILRHRTQDRTLPVELAVHIASRVARGLAYAHKRMDADGVPLEIVHRDVCPSNILITTEGLSKLADFGVAKVTRNLMLGDDSIVGKMRYMAPEQALGGPVDFRADIFSLGAVLFEMLTFKPIRSEDGVIDGEQAARVVARPIPWRELPAALPKDLAAILKKMLAADPAKRYQDTNQAAYDLEYFIYGDGYGPTIQTLERYLREHFSYLYAIGQYCPDPSLSRQTTVIKPGAKGRAKKRLTGISHNA
jgi:serine/threonine protein kinase